MSKPDVANNPEKLEKLDQEYRQSKGDLEKLSNRWESRHF